MWRAHDLWKRVQIDHKETERQHFTAILRQCEGALDELRVDHEAVNDIQADAEEQEDCQIDGDGMEDPLAVRVGAQVGNPQQEQE